MLDLVWLKILHAQLVNICEEMGLAMMRTSYSPIFSEGLDFCCLILDRDGELVAMQNLNPAMMGQALYSGRWVIDDLGADSFEPGDVVVHNDPYRGGSHMPEHLLITPFFHGGALQGWVCNIAHVAEIGGMAPGSFSANATEIYQEGLRLPPVKLFRRGEPVQDVWRILLANHRTPDHSWGDFNAIVGSLRVGLRRLEALYDEHGADANRDLRARPLRLRGAVDQARHRRPPRRHVLGRGLPGGRRLRQAQLLVARRPHDPRGSDGRRLEPHRSTGSRHHQRSVPRDGIRDVRGDLPGDRQRTHRSTPGLSDRSTSSRRPGRS